ncbi:MAG: glycosyltransferase family 4 protein [Candidatus Aminicenantales bacterium]
MSLFLIDAEKEWKTGQKQTFFIARELKKRGYSFLLVAQPESCLHHKALEEELPVLPLKMGFTARVFLAREMKKHNCLVAHFDDGCGFRAGAAASQMAHVPLRILSTRKASFQRNFFSWRRYRKGIDRIVAPSEGVRMMLMRRGLEARLIEIIPCGVDFSPFEKAYSSNYFHREFSVETDKYLVGILSHLPDEAAHYHLLHTARILREFTERIKVIVISDGPLNIDLRTQTRELDGGSMIYILGLRQHLPHILSSLDVFVISSFPRGLGNSLLDAMASRIPVIVEKAEDIPHLIIHGETGLFVPPGDSSYLASTILALFKNRELASRLGERGYEFVKKNYSARSMAERVISLYEREAERKKISLAQMPVV